MEDSKIIELFWERSENAISEADAKYGKYCYAIAYNILYSEPDSEECVNDTYLRAWNAIPPERPLHLRAFLGRITRNLALNRYAVLHAKKRGNGTELALEELAEVLADPDSEIDRAETDALREALNRFLGSLPRDTRIMFVRRYFYLLSITEIADGLGASENRVKVTLHRTREKLRSYLEKEGIVL